MDCNICLTDDISIDKIKFLDCKHYICKSCFDKLVRNTCPYCRAIINDKEDGHYPPVNYDLSSFYQEDIYRTNFLSNYSLNNYDFDTAYFKQYLEYMKLHNHRIENFIQREARKLELLY